VGHIDPALLTQLITAAIALLTALGTLFVALAGYLKSKSNSDKLDHNTRITEETSKATDGIVSQLVASTKQSSFAAGQKDQADRQTDIQTAVDAAKKDPS
jgi:hypothetical protein